MERLDKFLCDSGAGTRSQVKLIMKAGRVRVDGVPQKDGSKKVDPDTQVITLDGERLGGKRRVVLMLNKPAGFVTATEDPRDKTVMELLPEEYRRLFPVGRLDKQTEGLLLFTNDGELGHRLTSPKHQVEKRYYAQTEGQPDRSDAEAFAEGILLRDGTKCLPAKLEPIPGGCYVTVREGKYHQVRRMLASRGKPVTYLRREAEGGLTLGDLERGTFRILSEDEVTYLL